MNKIFFTIQKLYRIIFSGVIIFGATLFSSCGEEAPKEQGVISEIEEVEKGEFKIANEKMIDDPKKSMAIIRYMDGKIDTLNTEQVKTEVTKSGSSTASFGTGLLGGALMYSMISRFSGGGNSNLTPNSGVYKNPDAFKNSSNLSQGVTKDRGTRAKAKVGSSRSYGKSSSSRSTRSYGG